MPMEATMTETTASRTASLFRTGSRAWQALVPAAWRRARARRSVRLELDPPPELRLRVARTRDEFEAAFRLMHDAYVESGAIAASPSDLYLTAHHALPSTTVLLAYWGERAVGALSIVREGPFGMPAEDLFDLALLRARGARLAEAVHLALAPSFAEPARVFFPLMKFAFAYSRDYFGADTLVITMPPAHADLYEALFAAAPIAGARVASGGSPGPARVVARHIDLHEQRDRLARDFAGAAVDRDVFGYCFEHELSSIEFPRRDFHTVCDATMTPEMMHYFFRQKSNVFAKIEPRKRAILASLYDDYAYAGVLPYGVRGAGRSRRSELRHDVRCAGSIELGVGHELARVRFDQASQRGFPCATRSLAADRFDLPHPRGGRRRRNRHARRAHRPPTRRFRIRIPRGARRRDVGALHRQARARPPPRASHRPHPTDGNERLI